MIAAQQLLLLFLLLCGLGGVFSALLPDRKVPLLMAGSGSLAALVLLLAAGGALLGGQPLVVELWRMPLLGQMVLEVDRLSALLLILVALVCLPVSIFSAQYLQRYLGRHSLRSFGVLYHLLFASIALVLVSADVVAFLLAWESMSVLCYLLVNFEHEREESTRAGFLMLAMGEAGTLAVVVALLLLAGAAGGLDFGSLRSTAPGLPAGVRWAVFLLSFLGFGVKAGLV